MTAQPAEPAMLVIGVGSLYRRDDAAGLLAARALRDRRLPGLTVIEHDGEGAALLDCWRGAAAALLLDAVSGGGSPGAVHRLDARAPLPTGLFGSAHAFGVAEAVELARALGELPPRLVILGIEGVSFEMGEGLSPAVAAGLPALVEQAALEIIMLRT